jgi:hypothetical protein
MHSMFKQFAAAAILCCGAAASHAADQDFTLFNNTGYTIDKVFVSAANKKSWGEDILGQASLDDHAKVEISFKHGESGCDYDLKVVYDDNEEAVWNTINLCDLSNIHLHWDKSAGVTRATSD